MVAGKKRLVMEIDIDTGKVLKVWDGQKKVAKAQPIKKLSAGLGKTTVTNALACTMLFTHSSPGCAWVLIEGKYYWICR